jgi:hypothetical protein
MTDCAAVAPTKSVITYTDVIRKFKEMKTNYYTERGCMISTLNDKFSKQFLEKHPDLKWREKYNKYAEATVLTAEININIFGKLFNIFLHRPIKKIHRWEYEYFFGFGGHNAGFSNDRIIMTFVETFDNSIDFEYLLMTGTLASADACNADKTNTNQCCTIDENYVKNALKLLVVGGYVKQWNAFNHFKQWFKENGFLYEFNTDNSETTTSFIFEDKDTESGYSYEVIEE